MNENCVFCKIINGDIPSYTVYEDDVVKAFLDISQTTKGHVLLIPKTHVANIFEYDTELAGKVLSKIPTVARAIKSALPGIEGLNIINNNGEVAYQSVFHSHFHLVPRYSNKDTFAIKFTDNGDKYSSEELEQVASAIRKEFN